MLGCADLIRTFDWASTPLGPRDQWPNSLRATVLNMLHTKQPMLLFWGPHQIQLYNDAFVPSFGRGKHPASMGQRARECWAEVWPIVGAQLEAVTERGEPAWYEDALIPIERNGRMEEVFWTYSYSAAFDDHDQINGILVIVTEVTGRVLSGRRLEVLSTLTIRLSAAQGPADVLSAIAAIPEQCPQDIPLVVIDAAPPDEAPNPVWPEPTRAFVTRELGVHRVTFGLSPRLPYDAGYESFIDQICEQVSSTLQRVEGATVVLATRRQRDDLLMQAPVAAALLIGPTHVFELANPRYCDLVGRVPTGKSFRDAFPELQSGPLPEMLDRVYTTGEPFTANETVVPLARLDGSAVDTQAYFNFSAVAVRDHTDAVIGLMVVAVEVSEQVRARQVLLDANRSKDEFLAMLGHELRNPLAPIVTALDLMEARDVTGTTVRERGVIARQVDHVVRLVDDLLDISRITRGLITLEREVIDLGEALMTAVELARPLAMRQRHRLDVHLRPGTRVFADPARLAQMASNLLVNAVKYTPEGGRIRVALRTDGDEAVVVVSDTGVGISPELLPRVFDPFVQDPQAIDRREGGLGIGLAIVRNLAVLHGGSATATSEGPGRGSEFSIRLPLVTAEEVAESPVLHKSGPTGQLVLVVDDNVDAAEMLGELLRAYGHDVTVVHHPDDALAVARDLSPHIGLLDIGLPGMDGYELAKQLKEVVPACRLIALTGYGQEADRLRGADAGFVAHLVKPADINELLAVMAPIT